MYTTTTLHSHRWTVLDSPVMLSLGSIQSPEFVTDLTGTYVVSLVFDTMRDANREDCLIGWDFPRGSCGNIRPTLDLNWTVEGDITNIENGGHFKPHSMSWAGDQETELGRFEAKRGGHQRIVLNVLGDAGELNAGHPRLKVEAHWAYWEKWVIYCQIAWVFFFGAGIAGVLLMVYPKRKQVR